jgi:hypothetical protein
VLELEDGESSPRSVIVITLSPRTFPRARQFTANLLGCHSDAPSVFLLSLLTEEEEILMRGVVKLQALLRGRLARVKYRKKRAFTLPPPPFWHERPPHRATKGG